MNKDIRYYKSKVKNGFLTIKLIPYLYGMKYNCPDEKYTYLATNSSIILSNDPNDCLWIEL